MIFSLKKTKNVFNMHILFYILIFFCKNTLGSIPPCNYPLSKRLNNGNNLLICSSGIFFYDSNFEKIINSINTTECSGDCVFSTAYSQFLEEDDGYVVVLHKGINYIFYENGDFITDFSLSYYSEGKPYSIICYEHLNELYHYSIIYTSSKKIIFNIYEFNSISKNINFNNSYYYEKSSTLDIGISCELMKYFNHNVFTCYYGDNITFYLSNFNISNNFEYISDLGTKSFNIHGNGYYKSDVMTNSREISVGCIGRGSHYCIEYNIKENKSTQHQKINTDGSSTNALLYMVKYFPETNEFIAGCFTGKTFYYFIYYPNLSKSNVKKKDNILYNDCNSPLILDIIYSTKINDYLILTSESNNCGKIFSINKINDIFFDNFEIFDHIPEGYFLTNNSTKIIEKCYSDCKTCEKKEIIGNTNCKTCKNNTYLDLGNCLSSCENGVFIDREEIKRCKCSNIKCEFCSIESKALDLCITCNKELGYYQIENDTIYNNSFINCYKDPDNYYLYKDNDTYIYKPCHKNCKKCIELGDEINNKCLECNVNMSFLDDFPNIKNCYNICEFFYYFDSDNNFCCTKEKKCPENYNFVIKNKNKCIDDCKKDNLYKFQYKNECYISCPEHTELVFDNICNDAKKEFNLIDFLRQKGDIETENEETKEQIINEIRAAISDHSIDSLIDDILKEGGEDLTIIKKDIKYQISSSTNQNFNEYKNISNIKLGKCENKLKQIYNINPNEPLLIFKIDIIIEGFSSAIVEYEVYHPNTKEKLDLKYCEKEQIDISIPVSIDENILFKYDQKNEFYNDICSTYTTDKGTDITLNDRQNEFINNNMTLCEPDCDYNNYDFKYEKVVCRCNIKINFANIYDISIDTEKLINKFNVKKLINLKIIKCYKKVFNKNALINNIGSYILLSIIFIYSIHLIVFIFLGYKNLKKAIEKILNEKESKKEINIILTKGEINIINDSNKEKIDNIKRNNEKEIEKNNIGIIINDIKPISDNKKNKKKRRSIKNRPVVLIDSKDSKSPSSLRDINSILPLNISKTINDLSINNNENLQNINKTNKNNSELYKSNNIIKLNDYELNVCLYKTALLYDKRTFFQYYWSLLRTKHILIFAIVSSDDYNSQIIKLCIFIFSFAEYYAVNALFFNEETLHNIYIEKGIYDIVYQLPQIIYASIISSIINIIIKFFSLTEKDVIELKNNKNEKNLIIKLNELLNCLIIKFILFFMISFLFLAFFWLYLSCFGVIYKNTQVYLLKDTLISFGLSLIYPFFIYLLPGIFRIPSLRAKNSKKECLYKISKIIQSI